MEGNSFLDASTYSKNYAKGEAVLADSLLLVVVVVVVGSQSRVLSPISQFANQIVECSLLKNTHSYAVDFQARGDALLAGNSAVSEFAVYFR